MLLISIRTNILSKIILNLYRFHYRKVILKEIQICEDIDGLGKLELFDIL